MFSLISKSHYQNFILLRFNQRVKCVRMKIEHTRLQTSQNIFSIRSSFLDEEKGLSRKPLHWATDDMWNEEEVRFLHSQQNDANELFQMDWILTMMHGSRWQRQLSAVTHHFRSYKGALRFWALNLINWICFLFASEQKCLKKKKKTARIAILQYEFLDASKNITLITTCL